MASLSRRSLMCVPAIAAAQAPWRPTQPLRVVVAAAPGGTLDIHARAAQPLLAEALGQPVIVENQGGAGGMVAAQQVARAVPDGLTMLVGSGDTLVLQDLLLGPRQGRVRPALKPLMLTISAAQLLCTHPRSGLTSVRDCVAALRARGDHVTLAVPGIGGIAHVVSEMLNRALGGVSATHVPYRGGGPATLDLLAGQVDAMIITLPAVTGHVREGRIIPLAVSTQERDPALPDVPSLSESVAPGFDVPSTQGVLLPAAVPEPVVATLHQAWRRAMLDPGVKARLEGMGFVLRASTPAGFAASMDQAEARFAEVIRAAGITAESG